MASSSNSNKRGLIFIVSGPSGVGKDTIVKALREQRGYKQLNLNYPETYTTRRRRKNDENGVTVYRYISEKKFAELMLVDMIEHSENHGHFYGMAKSSFEECLAKGGNVIKIMDRDSAKAFKDVYPEDCVLIYLKPPSLEILKQRLKGRDSETPAEYSRRMLDNIEEMKDISGFDYVVVAQEMDITVPIVFGIIKANVDARRKNE